MTRQELLQILKLLSAIEGATTTSLPSYLFGPIDDAVAALAENSHFTTWTVSTPHLVALVNLAIEREREACAEVCKEHADVYEKIEQNPTAKSAWAACIDNRDAIRVRGNTMTKNDIIRMAREAGLPMAWISNSGVLTWTDLKAFAALVAAAEREACAAICEEEEELRDHTPFDCALRIRAEGTT